jgi:endonuclease YncB( thermonuclease family)
VAKAVFKTARGFSVGVARLGRRGTGRGSPAQQIYDGDTVTVEADGNLGVRLLGVDAPELAFTLPEVAREAVDRRPGERFVALTDPRWERFLSVEFVREIGLRAELRRHLEPLLGPGCAENHSAHAKAAREALRAEVSRDLEELSQDREEFRFFMAFSSEVLDGYGRFLCFLNRDQPRGTRPPSYNDRLLQDGHVVPYFIWPNVSPFREQPSLVDAVPRPRASLRPLDDARASVADARERGDGVWSASDPLRLLPFELRYIARAGPPDRWVIDLSEAADRLLAPQLYGRIDLPEDRLFVPPAFVALFETKGWRAVRS